MSTRLQREPQDPLVILPIPRESPAAPPRRKSAGYTQVPNEVIDCPELSLAEHWVFVALRRLCYRNTAQTRATTREIARAAGVHPITVRRAFRPLIKLGFISRRPDPGAIGGRWITHVLRHPGPEKAGVQDSEQGIVNGCAIPVSRRAPPLYHDEGGPCITMEGGPFHSLQDYFKDVVVEDAANDDDASSAPPPESKTPEPRATPTAPEASPAVADLAARVCAAWPEEPAVESRVAELVALAGNDVRRAALVIEYAAARKVKQFGYTFVVLEKSWRNLSLAECEEIVANVHPKRPLGPQQGRPPEPPPVAQAPAVVSEPASPADFEWLRRLRRASDQEKAAIVAERKDVVDDALNPTQETPPCRPT